METRPLVYDFINILCILGTFLDFETNAWTFEFLGRYHLTKVFS